ncbi:MAG TPA: hypothetical protein VHC44_13395 [Verrucomicrobiae bacterium]|nr:hypothetical protein [Verrucomicrobiae bacterium]
MDAERPIPMAVFADAGRRYELHADEICLWNGDGPAAALVARLPLALFHPEPEREEKQFVPQWLRPHTPLGVLFHWTTLKLHPERRSERVTFVSRRKKRLIDFERTPRNAGELDAFTALLAAQIAKTPVSTATTLTPTYALPHPPPAWRLERLKYMARYEYGFCAGFGDYRIYLPWKDHPRAAKPGWSQQRATASGAGFTLSGKGPAPSAEQLELWRQIEARLDALVKEVTEAAEPPPERAESYRSGELKLRSLELGNDAGDTMRWSFYSPFCDDIALWPDVLTKEWKVVETEWNP